MSQIIFSIVAFAAIVLLFVAFAISRKKSSGLKGRETVFAGIWWFAIFLSALAISLYYYLTREGLGAGSVFMAIALSLASSIRIFSFTPQVSLMQAMNNGTPQGTAFIIAYVFLFVAATIWTQVVLVKTLFKGIANAIKLWFITSILAVHKLKGTHYIVVGCGESAKTFLKNFKKLKIKDSLVVLAGSPNGDKAKAKSEYQKLLDKGIATSYGEINESQLIKAGLKAKRKKIVVVSLSDDDEENITIAQISSKFIASKVADKTGDELEAAVNSLNIEIRVMYSYLDRTEHFVYAQKAYGKVRFFNPYELRVKDFFWRNPITSFVSDFIDYDEFKARLKGDIGSDGKIINPHTAKPYAIKNILIGFGKANLHMLRGSVLTGQLLGVDYNAIVYDKDIADYNPQLENFNSLIDPAKKSLSLNQARFINNAPGLFKGGDKCEQDKTNTYFDSPVESYNISFKKAQMQCCSFYNSVVQEVMDSDFSAIYISLGDDKLAVETALELKQRLLEGGANNKKVKIFLKTQKQTALNKMCASIESEEDIAIKCFGLAKNILTIKNVLAQEYDELVEAITCKNHGTKWAFTTELIRESNRQLVFNARTKLQLLGFDFVKKSDSLNKTSDSVKANFLLRYGLDSVKNSDLVEIVDYQLDKTKKPDYLQMSGNKIIDNARNNLARLEHARWNIFHLLNGWTKYPKEEVLATKRKCERTKRHACITTFLGLKDLRELQAEKLQKENSAMTKEEAIGETDTIWYDYSLMDEILRGKNTQPPTLAKIDNSNINYVIEQLKE